MSTFESQKPAEILNGWLPVLVAFAVLTACFFLLGYVIYGDF